MVDYKHYIQDILESTKTRTLYLQCAKMEEVSHYNLCPKHFRRDKFGRLQRLHEEVAAWLLSKKIGAARVSMRPTKKNQNQMKHQLMPGVASWWLR